MIEYNNVFLKNWFGVLKCVCVKILNLFIYWILFIYKYIYVYKWVDWYIYKYKGGYKKVKF